VAVIAVLSFFSIFFFIAFEQSGVSLTLLAEQHVDRVIPFLGNLHYSASWFQTVNPLAILILAPLFAALWPVLRRKGYEPPVPLKMAIGLIILSIGFMVILPAAQMLDAGNQNMNPLWLVLAYVIFTMGELCLSPIGLSMVFKLSPLRFTCLLMAIWFLASSVGSITAGYMGSLYPSSTRTMTTLLESPIDGFTSFFMIFVVMSALAGVILIVISKSFQK
jgi:proton-dependent oligopeptide transporter, POT family